MTEDGIEKIIGRFGRYQAWILFLICLGRCPTDFHLNTVVFILPGVNYKCLDDNGNSTNHCPCDNPEYDRTVIASSVVTEWNLICDRAPLASLSQSILQVGILTGSLIYGYISDRYGRKIAVVLSLFLETAFISISAVVPHFWMFLVCRFIIGINFGGTVLCTFVYLIELCGTSFRAFFIGINEVFFIVVSVMLPVIAYFVRDWRNLLLVTSAPWLIIILYFWLIPESPRWLLTVGKKKEAIVLLTYIAQKNNRPTDCIESIVEEIDKETHNEEHQKQGTYLDLFKNKKLRFYTIIAALLWMFCSHTYYGTHQFIGRLEGNIYLNVILSSSSMAPGLLLLVLATVYLKRKTSIVTAFSISALSLLAFTFTPVDMKSLSLAFAVIGLTGAYVSFMFMYLFTSEIFPTVIRNSAMGFSSMFARVGGFVAPFVVNIGIKWVSVLVFSIVAFAAAVLCCFLPETKDVKLLNSIEQTEKIHVENKLKSDSHKTEM